MLFIFVTLWKEKDFFFFFLTYKLLFYIQNQLIFFISQSIFWLVIKINISKKLYYLFIVSHYKGLIMQILIVKLFIFFNKNKLFAWNHIRIFCWKHLNYIKGENRCFVDWGKNRLRFYLFFFSENLFSLKNIMRI